MSDFLILSNLQKRYLFNYLLLYGKKISFFRQHDLWKFQKLLIKLFDYPETINSVNAFALNLCFLEYCLNLKEVEHE